MPVQIRNFSHTYLSSAGQLAEKLKALCQDNTPGHHEILQELADVPVKDIVVSSSHLALLLSNGYIYRWSYSLNSSDGHSKERNDDETASTSSVVSGSRGTSPERTNPFIHRLSSLARGGRVFSRRLIERRHDRMSRTILGRVPNFVPAAEVPEDLIEEAMAVLQGKTRDVVIRELQRTHLDVNTAVNNLLSRDEDEPPHSNANNDEENPQFPSGDELITLMGTGALVEDELEELLSLTSRNRSEESSSRSGREGRVPGMYTDPLVAQEIRSWVTLADRAATGNGSAPSSSTGHTPSGHGSKSKGGSSSRKDQTIGSTMYFYNKLRWVNDNGHYDRKFSHISGLKSELLAVDEKGVLYSWPWDEPLPPTTPHPRLAELGLQGERVKLLSSKLIRASAVTDSGKIATWLDPCICKIGRSLEHSATVFPELSSDTVIYLVTSELFSTIYTDAGKLMWWGVLPYTERKGVINHFQDKNRSSSGGASLFGRGNQIQEGSQVCLRSRPIYSSGCKAVYIKGDSVVCGELLESVLIMSDKCRFKILPMGGADDTESMETESEERVNQPGPSTGSKRRHPDNDGDDDTEYKEELWSLRDVIFLSPPFSSARIGHVMKLDGFYAAVLFPSLNKDSNEKGEDKATPTSQEDNEEQQNKEQTKDTSVLSQCRLLRRDDLVVISSDSSHPDPVCVQATPKRFKLPPDSIVLALTADIRTVHTIVVKYGTMSLSSYNFETSRINQNCTFPVSSSNFLLQQLPPGSLIRSLPMKLISLGLSLWLLIDSIGGLYVLSRDATGAIKPLTLLNFPLIHTAVHTPQSAKNFIVTMAMQTQKLIPKLRTCSLNSLRNFLDSVPSPDIEHYLKEQTHGGCNILHLLGTLCTPTQQLNTANYPTTGSGRNRSGYPSLREIMHQSLNLPTSSVVEARLWSVGMGMSEGDTGDDGEETRPDRSSIYVSMLHHFSTLSTVYHDLFLDMMSMVNVYGYTPFESAIANKSYSAALELLNMALQLSDYQEGDEEAEAILLAMVYPPGSHPDDNPLFLLCRGDPCSFTWTGEEHIHQNIFECRTCGLVGSLCCCTECAYNCHRGHDCSFKRASPNAYCDCWERCACQALTSGDENTRMMVLHRLLDLKILSHHTNSRGEYLIGMLAGTVARQVKEQSQWGGKKPAPSHLRRSRNEGNPCADVPPHTLLPPKFALKSIAVVLEDWPSVKAVLTCDCSPPTEKSSMGGTGGGAGEWPFTLSMSEQQKILESQQSTKHLDVLAYTMLAKTSHQNLEAIITTLITQLGPNRDNPEALVRCQRFIRAVIRALVVCELEKMAGPESLQPTIRRKISIDGEHCFIYKDAMFVLNSLAPIAIPELITTARGLILPVCLGVARPFLPNLMNDKHKVAEELFAVPPADLFQKQTKTPLVTMLPAFGTASETGSTGGRLSTGGGGGVSDSDSEPGDGEDTHILGDASSTATIGSGPLPFFSDPESSDGEDLDTGGEEESLDGGDLDEENDSFTVPDTIFGSRIQATTHWAVPEMTNGSMPSSKKFSRNSSREVTSYGTSASLLSRAFSMLIRLTADLMESLSLDGPHPPFVLHSQPTDHKEIYSILWSELDGVWHWLSTVMDSTESQLRLGCALNATWTEIAESSNKPSSSANAKSSDTLGTDSRRGFLNYMLSLMRAESSEHGGSLPGLDVSKLEFVAWTLDALMYVLMRVSPPASESAQHTESMDIDSNHPPLSDVRRKFFRRSSSTLCLPYPPPSPFAPLMDTLPLAEKPHLLHPRQTKEMLFGYGQQDTMEVWPDTPIEPSPMLPLIQNPVPLKTSLKFLSDKREPSTINKQIALSSKQILCETNHSLTASVIMGRWCMSVELLSRVFADTLGKQQYSIFSHLQSFENIERDMRREMDNLRAMVHRDLQLEVERAREHLLPSLFRQLNNQCEYRRVGSGLQPLCAHRIRVSFKNEPGEGSGVLRSFFTAVAEAYMSDDPLPELDYNVSTNSRGMSLAEVIDEYTGKVDIECPNPASLSMAELCPLFFQPGKAGYYSIRVGSHTPARINAYRNVGRVIGLALLHSEMMPLPLCRHVYKFILAKRISWHDMAFFDPIMYEGLRKLILSAHQEPEQIKNMDLSWQVTLGEYEGGGTHPLLSTQSNKPVNTGDVYEYVQRYSELRMLKVAEEPLRAIRTGVHDVLPSYTLDTLSAEAMRLLLCGCQQVDLDTLKKITMFSDESKRGSDHISRFKTWFWSIVDRMSNREKQDLLYFWTSSPSMPANPESYRPPPSVTIRPADDQHLPTSNTCISRLYIPLYSSKALLKSKLLASIKIKAFGFI